MISGDQTGYVKGRFIEHNIRLVEDIIHYANHKQSDSIIAILDVIKAFDCIEWELIYEVLATFNVVMTTLNGLKLYIQT